MARPTKPKDIKPKAEGDAPAVAALPGGAGSSSALDLKFIITIVAIVLCTTVTSGAATYFLAPMVILPALEKKLDKIASASHGEEGEGAGGDAHVTGPGMNLELDEFMVNLKPDPSTGSNQYLRAKMSMNVQVPEAENCYLQGAGGHHAQAYPDALQNGRILGAAAPLNNSTSNHPELKGQVASGGGAPVDPVIACTEKFKGKMAKYIPTIRDVINASLMKRTAGTLSTIEGQEALKDEIKEEINQFLVEGYEVSRVNFEDFIIQR